MSNPSLPSLNTDFVRQQFPALTTPELKDQAFFENAGGSYTCRQVVDRLTRFYATRKVQPYGHGDASRLGGEEMDEARERLAAMMGVETDELSFGPSTSQNSYVMARAFAETLASGDAVIVTDQDHEANSGVWRRLEAHGIEVREWHINRETGQLDVERLEELLDKRVKLVCFPHCSNIIGQENPVARIVKLVHGAGAAACVDGVSMAPHGFPDVGKLCADIYMFSGYKTYGPHQGIMVVRRNLADRLANQGHFFNAEHREKRFTPAGPDHAQVAACAGMADYVDALHAHHFKDKASPAERAARIAEMQRAHEDARLAPLLDFLGNRNDVRLIGGAGKGGGTGRVPTLALETRRPADEIANELTKKGVMAGSGDFYAVRTLKAAGCDPKAGVLRLSFVHYTNDDEVNRLMSALDASL